jgi:hypothetical protein
LGFLGLQEQRVLAVPAEQQQDPGPGADAADAADATPFRALWMNSYGQDLPGTSG